METRWSLSEVERQRLASERELGMRDVISALIARPALIRNTVLSALSGAKRGVREDAAIGWYLSGQRLRKAAPGVATGALWYGDHEFVEAIKPYISSDTEALEIGAGAGRVSRLVAPLVERLVCSDISEPLLDEARQNLAGVENIEYVVADGTVLDRTFGLESFDLVFAHDVFVTIDPDPTLAILDSAAKVLRPGGHLAASFLTIDHETSGRTQLELVRRAAAKGRFGISHPRTYTADQVNAMFELVGLEVVAASYAEDDGETSRPHYTVVGKAPAN